MRILKDFKIPDFKFPKFKMEGLSEIDEVNVNYEDVKKAEENRKRRKKENFPTTSYKTIKEIFEKSTKEYADKELILEKFAPKGEFTEITYKQFGEDVINFGTALVSKLGLKDKRIIIIGENTYHWYVSYMAMLCGVGIAVPVDKELPENEIENVIKRSKASAVIYSTKKQETIKKIQEKIPEVQYFIQMNSETEINERNVGMNYLIEQGKQIVEQGDNSFININVEPDEFKVLIFTSGTTSNSKGVMLCNRNLAENINDVLAYVNLTSEDRLMSILPLHHTYESTIGFLLPFAVGASISVCQGLKYIVSNLQETKPTSLLTVPLLIENLYKKINANIQKSKKENLVNSMIHLTNALKVVGVDIKKKVFKEIYDNLGGRIKYIVSAAAPIDAKIGKWLEDIGIIFLQGYGLTETSPVIGIGTNKYHKVGSIGKTVPSVEAKVVDCNKEGIGELIVKGPNIMIGYYQNEEATKKAIVDGWFYTGDLARIDEEGYIFICGRKKDVIVLKNGKNIYPEEMENLINKIEGVEESFIYGKQLSSDKENIKIYAKIVYDEEVVKNAYKVQSKEEIHKEIANKIREINSLMPKYKAIRGFSLTKEPLIKTTTNKLKRQQNLEKILEEERENGRN